MSVRCRIVVAADRDTALYHRRMCGWPAWQALMVVDLDSARRAAGLEVAASDVMWCPGWRAMPDAAAVAAVIEARVRYSHGGTRA